MAAQNSKRGLASTDRKTREEVARKGGESRGGRKKTAGTRGGSHEQHVKAGKQSHKRAA